MPKVSREYLEERKSHIIDSAVRVFSLRGFHEATLEDIRLEAGVSRGAVYHYFKSKEDIVLGLTATWDQVDTDLFTVISDIRDPLMRLTAFIDSVIARLISPSGDDANRLDLMLWSEALLNPRIMQGLDSLTKRSLQELTAIFRSAQETGLVAPELSVEGAARAIAGSLFGILLFKTWNPDWDVSPAVSALKSLLQGQFRTGLPSEV